MNNNELNEFLFLSASDKSKNPYTLPKDYFDTLPDIILTEVKLMSIGKSADLSVAQDYFSEFPSRILNRIKNEAETETPVLNSISKTNVYTVPENYFDNLNKNISAKAGSQEEKKETKIIPLKKHRRVWQMSVAAAVVFAIVLGAGALWQNGSNTKTKTGYASATISNTVNIEDDLSKLSDDEISAYLDTPDGSEDSTLSVDNLSMEQTQQQLQNVPNQEMENYLTETPQY